MICKNIDEYNPGKKRKVLIVFDDVVADMISTKKLDSIMAELFIRGWKINITIAFIIMKLYLKVPKEVGLNSTHFFIIKIPNKRELQQMEISHSTDIDLKDFMKIYKECSAEKYSFLVNDMTLSSNNPLRFRNLWDSL